MMGLAPSLRLPSLAELASSCHEPRVHPNGFIQLDMSELQRIHVWHPRLPYRQRTYHPVHDHAFAFTSMVHSGRLVNVQYDIASDDLRGAHYVAEAEGIGPSESVLRPVEPGRFYKLSARSPAAIVQPGERYHMDAGVLHETLSNEPTLTVMRKDYPGTPLWKPRVMVPRGVAPDNEFRRSDVDTDLLWELIAEAHPS